MKRFFRQVLSIALGIFASLVLTIGIIFLLVQLCLRPGQLKLADKTVLHIPLRGTVVEQANAPLEGLFSEEEEVIDLRYLKKAINYAQEEKNIKGIYLEAGTLRAGWASLEEIRSALDSFRQAGKFVVAYGESYTQKTYYLASLADEIILNPAGSFLWIGLSRTAYFYKSLLDSLGIAPQIFRVGQYKSAVEPFMRQDMSPHDKQQRSELYQEIYNHFLDQIAAARTIKKVALRKMAEKLAVILPSDACQANLISSVGYFDEAEALIKEKLVIDKEASIDYLPYKKYVYHKKHTSSQEPLPKNKIAVLIAEGNIVDGKSSSYKIGSKDLTDHIRDLRANESVKAVVLRINSPGGSSLASEVLWKELMLLREKKPIVASMSDVAASGGYYLASACHCILAHATTITGSIGIWGLFFDVNALLSKWGITTDVIKTSTSADVFNNPGRPWTDYEKAVIQSYVDKGYATFLDRVASGRGLPQKEIARVASGRVWSGKVAQKQKLVDRLGALEDAVCTAAQLADIEKDYVVSYFPESKTLVQRIFKNWKSEVINFFTLRSLRTYFPDYKHVQELIDMTGIQARLPYEIEID